MSFTINTPFMNLTLPQPTLEPGPQWAVELNAAMTLVDSHNHSTGQGAPILAASININSDLAFNNNNLTTVRSVRFQNQGSPLNLPADVTSIYASGGDLWYNNLSGQQVKITSGSTLNAGSIGGIGGDYTTSGALELYTSATTSYSFTTDGTQLANMFNGAMKIYRTGTSDFGVTLQAPGSISASYSLTFPATLPAAQTALSVSATGQISAGVVGGTVADVIPSYGLTPSGAILPYGGTSAPAGYLFCDGTSYLRSAYPALFTAISTAYGTADGTHFNVPDLRGYFLRGTDNGAGRDPSSASRTAMNAGGNTADAVGSVQQNAVEDHIHGIIADVDNATNGGRLRGTSNTSVSGATVTTTMQSGTPGPETRPLNAYVNYIIKT